MVYSAFRLSFHKPEALLSFRIQALENNEDENWKGKDPVVMYKWDVSGIVSFSSSVDFRESHLKTWFTVLVTRTERKKSNVPFFRLFEFRQRSYATAFSTRNRYATVLATACGNIRFIDPNLHK